MLSRRELRDTGSPYGVLAPPRAGITYVDEAGSLGAWEWLSTGTTNTSWVVKHGDTGWRNMASLLANGWTATYVHVRRTGSTVWLRIRGLSGAGATATTVLTLPTGFRPSSTLTGLLVSTSGTVLRPQVSASGPSP